MIYTDPQERRTNKIKTRLKAQFAMTVETNFYPDSVVRFLEVVHVLIQGDIARDIVPNVTDQDRGALKGPFVIVWTVNCM